MGPSRILWCPSNCCKRSVWTNTSLWKSVDTNGKSSICATVRGFAVWKINSGGEGLYCMQIPEKKVCSFWGKNDLELQRQVVFIGINCCRFIVFCYAPPDLSLSSFFFFLNVHCFSPLVRAIFCHPVLEQGPYFICSNYCSNSGYLHLLCFSFLKGKKKYLKFHRLTLHRKYDKLQE